ncbi:MAG: dihydropteroate synthase [Candidatus Muiribacteriota bacterium]
MNFYNSSNHNDLIYNRIKNNKVSSGGLSIFQKKIRTFTLFINNISLAKALILKQDMLVCGGDVALPEDAVRGKLTEVNVAIIGTERNFEKLSEKLKYQKFLTKEIDLINNFISSIKKKILFQVRNKEFHNNKTYLMGIINVTPDSFSDGGKNYDINIAYDNCMEMMRNFVDIIDIGGQSNRPGASEVSEEEELERVIPLIEKIRKNSLIPVSIDTCKTEVAREAMKAGADIINCVSGATLPDKMADVAGEYKAPFILMHMRGTPEDMQTRTGYQNLTQEIIDEISDSYNILLEKIGKKEKIIIDPGIGFGKTVEQNWEIIKNINSFRYFGSPLLVGASRKSFLSKSFNLTDNTEKDLYTLLVSQKMLNEGVNFLRVHNVKMHREWLDRSTK